MSTTQRKMEKMLRNAGGAVRSSERHLELEEARLANKKKEVAGNRCTLDTLQTLAEKAIRDNNESVMKQIIYEAEDLVPDPLAYTRN